MPKLKENIIELNQVSKRYDTPNKIFYALKDINLNVATGEFLAIVGKSGSGKSTLLNILTGIDCASSGEVFVSGSKLNDLSESQMSVWRGQHIGIVFQFFQLMPTLSILENIMLPMDFCNSFPKGERKDRALALLEQVNIVEQANKFPSELSGGQQQRVAIARALANDPKIIFADEPTGNLDSSTAEQVFELFKSLSQAGKTVIMVTHDASISSKANRTITLSDGLLLTSEQEAKQAETIEKLEHVA